MFGYLLSFRGVFSETLALNLGPGISGSSRRQRPGQTKRRVLPGRRTMPSRYALCRLYPVETVKHMLFVLVFSLGLCIEEVATDLPWGAIVTLSALQLMPIVATTQVPWQ